MTQHFLLSAASRTLKLKAIYQAGEDAAYAKFCALRWPETGGEAVCPRCGCCETYAITTRRKFKCKACAHQFSVTSGTIFASRKLAFVDMLAAICIVANAAKSLSAVQLSRDVGVQYKTAFVLAHKIREALADETEHAKFSGVVEIDGCYVGGHIRPANEEKNRVDRRRAEHQSAPIRPKAISRASAEWSAASITTFRRSTFTNTPRTPHGLKITAAKATARSPTGLSGTPWPRPSAANGKDIGSASPHRACKNSHASEHLGWAADAVRHEADH